MKLPVNFSFSEFTTEFILLMRKMADQINRTSDALQFVQAVNTGAANKITRLLTATATLDFPLTAAGTISTLNITVTGAVIGDALTIIAPATLEAGLMFCGLITAANTVTVRLHNTTAAGIDPASASWKALVVGIG